MAADYTNTRKSNTQILQELEALSDSLYQSHTTTRRTASLVLSRADIQTDAIKGENALNPRQPRQRRMSLSPWRSRPKLETGQSSRDKLEEQQELPQKKGIWNWKPIRALTHIGMQKLSCLFSVEVVTVQNLPASMNGLRLSVCVRKQENRDGAVQTMPSRVSQGAADFEETLFVRCHVYYTPGSGTNMKFESRPFLIYVVAVDADELDFGKNSVDLSRLIQESVERSLEGSRLRQWDRSFGLLGKARGGELVLKLGFQIMEKDGGTGIYSSQGGKPKSSPSFARKQSKTSFSVPSPRITGQATPTPTDGNGIQEMDELNLDEPAPPPHPVKQDTKGDDQDLPDFEVVDKGVEIPECEDEESEENSVKSEVVKEVVGDKTHVTRLTALDSIAQQIKALESLVGDHTLDSDEDKVTRDFLQMLDDNDKDSERTENMGVGVALSKKAEEKEVFLPDLGRGLGCVVQTRNGGYLAAANPLDTSVGRKDMPKLALQVSRPVVIPRSGEMGFEVFQKMAAVGLEELTSRITALMPLEELQGKTAEQIAFEGIASAIVMGRNKEEGATSSAARSIEAVRAMARAANAGRRERVTTGIWSVTEEPVAADEILPFSLQKIESTAVEGLKIQADVAEEEAPFDVSSPGKSSGGLLDLAVPVGEWEKMNGPDVVNVVLTAQLRDPGREYEAVGGPMMVVIHVSCVAGKTEEERKYRVGSMQVGGVKVRTAGKTLGWDSEKQRLTALHWLLAHGMGKKKGRRVGSGKGPDLLWSVSSRVMADMWLKPIRNPDVKFVAD
ncbi:plastid movement impaired1 [Striga hermonthica]|uniref:Plastid movement impaired1 n=1 Tax=Striga hermonthica TaxID=68872 RepID=A0A9N7NA11_STRHE|nr:plastid movement impaired1 [Striga hermonthica]